MKKQNLLLLFVSIFVFCNFTQAAVRKQSEEQKLLEELTGKKNNLQAPSAVVTQPAAPINKPAVTQTPISRKLLDAGFFAYTKKNYISALKHYNTIIVKYPKSNELQLAYLAKAKLYQAMGLLEQAQFNIKLANEIGKKQQIIK